MAIFRNPQNSNFGIKNYLSFGPELDIEQDFRPNGMITDYDVLCIFCSESFKSNRVNE